MPDGVAENARGVAENARGVAENGGLVSGEVVGKQIISTDRAPGAIGPYSQAVRSGGLLFVSGQIPLDPETGLIVAGGIAEQTERVLRNLAAVIEAAGGTLAQVVKTSCFLADMDDFPVFNETYGRFFAESPPARETVEVARLPKDALVEVSAVCLLVEGHA